jgi:hypothetical protein
MTRTEDRLADALQASAAQVRDDRLRRLSEPGPGLGAEPEPRTTRRGGWPRDGRAPGGWQGWLVPLAAAASVALVIGLALALTSGGRPGASGPTAGHGGTTSTTRLPRFFAQFTGTNPEGSTVVIRSVSTGAVVASAPLPRQAGWSMLADTMAAAPDGRTFYVAYTAMHAGATQTRIYRLGYAGTALTLIKGGVIPHSASAGVRGSMAVSPDGTKVALTVATPGHDGNGPGSMNKIVAVDLRTGSQAAWQGGLDVLNQVLLFQDVSWTADGRSLVFLVVWCDPAIGLNLCEEGLGPAISRAQQVRSVPVATGGGSLHRSEVLLAMGTTVPVIAHAIAGPRPDELTLVWLSGRKTTAGAWPVVTVQRLKVINGVVLSTEYRLVTGRGELPPRGVGLGADPSGQHLLLTIRTQGGLVTGWIGPKGLRLLPAPRQPYSGWPVTAW